jgi:hypothetical protein
MAEGVEDGEGLLRLYFDAVLRRMARSEGRRVAEYTSGKLFWNETRGHFSPDYPMLRRKRAL